MQVGVVGINHKQAPLSLREMIAKACDRRFGFANPLEEASFVLLSTCNRSELYFSSPHPAQTHAEILDLLKTEVQEHFEQKLYTFFGFDCFLHLSKVTSGLDSAIIAETEIQGQVRLAYDSAAKLRLLSKDLHYLFQKSLKIAKEVRSLYPISTQIPDLEKAIYWYANDYFSGTLPTPLFVGASDINLKIARYFQQKGITSMTFCNRTDTTSQALASDMQANFLPWSSLFTSWQNYELIICATKSPRHLLSDHSSVSDKKRLLLDLAVPRNINPALKSDSIQLLNIDDLYLLLEKRKALLAQKVIQAEESLHIAVKRQLALFRSRLSPLPIAVPC